MKINSDGTQQTTMDLIRDIIVHELELDGERVNVYNQDFKLPKDDGLSVLIEAKGMPKVLSNINKMLPETSSLSEYQVMTTQEQIAVVLFSRNMDAYLRAPEVLMAIMSTYSQQKQEENGFKIAKLSPIVDLSDLEGGAILFRLEASLVVFGWYQKTKSVDYYDTFGVEVMTEKETVEIPLN